MLGKWIDSLSDAQRDNVVTAMGWGYGIRIYFRGRRRSVSECSDLYHHESYAAHLGRRCLVDNAFDRDGAWEHVHVDIPTQFDLLCNRFGMERVVRAIKARAGVEIDIGERVLQES